MKRTMEETRTETKSEMLDIPDFSYEEGQVTEKELPVTYEVDTVEKNDTLQKISKKFYGSYSKWPKIYEVNKTKISDPDNIVAGTVLKVPVQK